MKNLALTFTDDSTTVILGSKIEEFHLQYEGRLLVVELKNGHTIYYPTNNLYSVRLFDGE